MSSLLAHTRPILAIPRLPRFQTSSPAVVLVCDKIRFALKNEIYSEFGWFIREYPRAYRYHLDCSEYRLRNIHEKYIQAHSYLSREIRKAEHANTFSLGVLSDTEANFAIYWDFDSFLSAINSALEILARIVGLAYKKDISPSFSKLCKRAPNEGLALILKNANKNWVGRMKDYRDCFVHYCPVDTIFVMSAHLYSNGWEIRSKLPTNPGVREMVAFRYSRRVELLKYAISTHRQMQRLDKLVALEIQRLYKVGEFPKRTNNLFFVGSRE
ncbi:hypothetical protein ACFLUU_00630 [Chloroflexota bacterium]